MDRSGRTTQTSRIGGLALASLCALLLSAPLAHANGSQGQIRVSLTIPERPPALAPHLMTQAGSEQLCSTARGDDRRELFVWDDNDPHRLVPCSEQEAVTTAQGRHVVMIAPI